MYQVEFTVVNSSRRKLLIKDAFDVWSGSEAIGIFASFSWSLTFSEMGSVFIVSIFPSFPSHTPSDGQLIDRPNKRK